MAWVDLAQHRKAVLAAAGCAAVMTVLAPGSAALAGPLVVNGNFASNTTLSVEQSDTASYDAAHGTNNWAGQQAGTSAAASSVTGWTFGGATSFNYVIDLNTYGVVSYNPAPGYTNGSVAYWDPTDGHFSAFNAIPGALGTDKFAIASDPAYNNAAIQQAISGLQVGDRYQLTFAQAATQQYGYSGAYTGAWQVSLGGQTEFGTAMTKPLNGYAPWSTVTLDFIATATSETLSFLSTANVSGNPPFLLLDDVNLADIPEPGTLGFLALTGCGLLAIRRATRAGAASGLKR